MLGKLLKHEFRNIGKIGLLLILITAGVTLLGIFYLISPMFDSIVSSHGDFNGNMRAIGAILGMLGLVSYIGVLFGISVGFMIYVSFRFYKSMYSDEGYLTHTLPVRSSDVIIVKLVTAGVWTLILTLAMYLSVGLLLLLGAARANDMSMFELMRKLGSLLKIITEYLYNNFNVDLMGSGIILIVSTIVLPFANLSIIFGSLTLGQCSWKNKGLMGIVAYIGVRMIMSIVGGVLNLGVTMFNAGVIESENVTGAFMLTNGRYLVSSGITLLFGIGLFCASLFIVKYRLNLE